MSKHRGASRNQRKIVRWQVGEDGTSTLLLECGHQIIVPRTEHVETGWSRECEQCMKPRRSANEAHR
jgi:hypothetical protein